MREGGSGADVDDVVDLVECGQVVALGGAVSAKELVDSRLARVLERADDNVRACHHRLPEADAQPVALLSLVVPSVRIHTCDGERHSHLGLTRLVNESEPRRGVLACELLCDWSRLDVDDLGGRWGWLRRQSLTCDKGP